MSTKKQGLQIVEIPVEDLEPNPWNVNKMSEEMQTKLTAFIKSQGLVEPIVVRPKGGKDKYEIIGGYHRWIICKDKLAYKVMPCIVVNLDDKKAKILSVNLNEMTGEAIPSLLANLLHDLSKEISIDDLETLLPYPKGQIEDLLDLLKLPEGLDSLLEKEAQKEEEAAPVVVSIVFDKSQNLVFETAVAKAQKETGAKKAAAVVMMAKAYLQAVPDPLPVPLKA